MIRFIKVIIILIFVSGATIHNYAYAQSAPNHKLPSKNKNSRAAKEKRRKEKEISKAEEEARNKHLNIQDKNTKKRMKRNRKMTKAKHDNKKELFIKKWFTN
jgi:hypothetical protein